MLQALADRSITPDLLVGASAARLIARARATTTRWLDAGNHRLAHPERFLSLHEHTQPTESCFDSPGRDAA
jgi:hypothetical protein